MDAAARPGCAVHGAAGCASLAAPPGLCASQQSGQGLEGSGCLRGLICCAAAGQVARASVVVTAQAAGAREALQRICRRRAHPPRLSGTLRKGLQRGSLRPAAPVHHTTWAVDSLAWGGSWGSSRICVEASALPAWLMQALQQPWRGCSGDEMFRVQRVHVRVVVLSRGQEVGAGCVWSGRANSLVCSECSPQLLERARLRPAAPVPLTLAAPGDLFQHAVISWVHCIHHGTRVVLLPTPAISGLLSQHPMSKLETQFDIML